MGLPPEALSAAKMADPMKPEAPTTRTRLGVAKEPDKRSSIKAGVTDLKWRGAQPTKTGVEV